MNTFSRTLIGSAALSALLIGLPVIANAQTAAQLSAQAQALLAQVQALQAQLGTSGGTSSTVTSGAACPQISRTLQRGVSGNDVTQLQQFLARDPSVYPEAQVTGYFGALTETAVMRWQTKYNIVSSGSPATTGYGVVGRRTLASIMQQCSSSTTVGGTTGVSGVAPTVGGFIQVTPIAGNVPLSIQVQATVNTVNSCNGATYTLDFGDGTVPTQIIVGAGNCGQLQQSYPHVYIYGGTYQITLSSGSHQTSATVIASGPSATATTVTTNTTTLHSDSLSTSISSGVVPLSVTFLGTVNSSDAVGCVANCGDILNFGDGGVVTIPVPSAANSWQAFNVSHTYTTTGTFNATLQSVTSSGYVNAANTTVTVAAGTSAVLNYTYGPLGVIPSAGSVSAQFDLPTSCTGYDLSWGDGSADAIQNDGGTSCAQTAVQKVLQHTYTTNGAFTISLRRGPTLAHSDSVGVTIVN